MLTAVTMQPVCRTCSRTQEELRLSGPVSTGMWSTVSLAMPFLTWDRFDLEGRLYPPLRIRSSITERNTTRANPSGNTEGPRAPASLLICDESSPGSHFSVTWQGPSFDKLIVYSWPRKQSTRRNQSAMQRFNGQWLTGGQTCVSRRNS